MGIQFAASSSSAEAPNIEGGMYDARFDAVVEKKDIPSQYGNSDCFEWQFTLFADGEPIYDEGEPVEVSGLTSQSMNTRSKTTPRAVKYLKAIMTPDEFKAFEAEEPVNAEDLVGRMVQVLITIKENGWPKVEDVLPVKRAARGK